MFRKNEAIVTLPPTTENLVYHLTMDYAGSNSWPNSGSLGGNATGNSGVLVDTTNYKSGTSSARTVGGGDIGQLILPGSVAYVATTGITICFWVRPTDAVFQHSWVHLRKNNTASVAEIAVFSQAANQRFSVRGSIDGGNQIVNSNMTWSINTWYHVAVVILPYNASNPCFCKLYVDGQEVTFQTPTNSRIFVNQTFAYNTVFDSVDYSEATSSIDEVRVHNSVLTDAQISAIYGQYASAGA